MNDFVGIPIVAGCTVVYPVRRGSKMWLQKLSVQSVDLGKVHGFNSEGRRVTIHNIANVVVVNPPANAV